MDEKTPDDLISDDLLTLINDERHEAYLLGVTRGVMLTCAAFGDEATALSIRLPQTLQASTNEQAWKKETL